MSPVQAICFIFVGRVESGTTNWLSIHGLGEFGQKLPGMSSTKLRNPRNHACMGGKAGYGHLTSWDLVLP